MNEEYRSLFPRYLMYGHSYVPNQIMRNVYTTEEALKKGSLFPELVSPYTPCQSMRVIEALKQSGGAMHGN